MYEIFRYVSFKSFVDPSFWSKLTEVKLDIDKLSDRARFIHGYYSNLNAKNCLLEVDCSSFNQERTPSRHTFPFHGILMNKNTIEDFKSSNKQEILTAEGLNLLADINSGRCIDDPSLLNRFILLSFADLKKHNFYYWFAFPAPTEPIVLCIPPLKELNECFNPEDIETIDNLYTTITPDTQKTFFILEKDDNDSYIVRYLAEKINRNEKESNFVDSNLSNTFFCFSDPSEFPSPGWNLRNFINLLSIHCPFLADKEINILSLRSSKNSIATSLIYKVKLPVAVSNETDFKWVGWEQSDAGKFLPKCANMASAMDPRLLAEQSVNLNLKLMKWRLLPDLNLETISATKCLLMGAGTLGCAVARTLIAWGVSTITFVDYGNVTYSNPVRQNLYTHSDAVEGKAKAPTAAERLREVHPGLIARGHSLHIPMPGHTVGDSMLTETIRNIETLTKLIEEHDVVYLLTDSRESRWLPTMLGAYHNKIVINAALGFDSYLVMRHGNRQTHPDIEQVKMKNLRCIPGNQLGCYFCNDITAPGNSMKDRTLDQQCTVTRPAVSNIASSIAVELMIALLQHKDREQAPAFVSIKGGSTDPLPEGLLGVLPHSVRGFLSTYDQILPATEKYHQCIACSEKVIAEYKNRGTEFLMQVFGSTKYLEDLTGITELLEAETEIIECGDSDFELSE